MKTKREVLKQYAQGEGCTGISWNECPFCKPRKKCNMACRLTCIGAMAILRMFRKKKKPILGVGTKIRFNSGDIATISKVDCGNVYYYNLVFGNGHRESFDYLIGKTWEVVEWTL